MAARCAFCNNSVILGEVEEKGKIYHPKCAPSARGVDPDAVKIVKVDEEQRRLKEEYAKKMPENLGSIEVGVRKGFVVDPVTGEKRWVEKYSKS